MPLDSIAPCPYPLTYLNSLTSVELSLISTILLILAPPVMPDSLFKYGKKSEEESLSSFFEYV